MEDNDIPRINIRNIARRAIRVLGHPTVAQIRQFVMDRRELTSSNEDLDRLLGWLQFSAEVILTEDGRYRLAHPDDVIVEDEEEETEPIVQDRVLLNTDVISSEQAQELTAALDRNTAMFSRVERCLYFLGGVAASIYIVHLFIRRQ